MKNRKGFTLAELLIVVAIIAVLVAIAIPIFTAQLEKSREATDASNIRAAYAELMSEVLLSDRTSASTSVLLTQRQASWQKDGIEDNIATGYSGKNVEVAFSGDPSGTESNKCYITYTPAGAESGAKASVFFEFKD